MRQKKELIIRLILYWFYKCFKSFWMTDSHIRKYFSIEFYLFEVEHINEFRIGSSFHSHCIINSHCPKSSEISFFEFSSDIRIETSFHPSIFSSWEYSIIEHSETFCCLNYFFMTFLCHECSFYTYHDIFNLRDKEGNCSS